jgi:hypothetical protein
MDNCVVKICYNGQKDCYFYKNGLLHREIGPAIIIGATKDDLINLEDSHLYKQEIIKAGFPPNYSIKFLLESMPGTTNSETQVVNATYYLKGEPYTEEEFMEAKAKLDLKKDLDNELSITQLNPKKVKI